MAGAVFVLASLSQGFLAAPASAQEACTTYTVKEGDTLGAISNIAYGTYDYQQIFNANRDLIAASPNALAAGTQLALPCLDGRLRPDTELSSITERETKLFEKTRVKTTEYTPAIRLVAGDGWFPFTDTRLKDGGVLTRLGLVAFTRGGNDRETRLDWVDDWDSHLDVLLPTHSFDLSIGWDGIDCSKMDLLSADMVRRCNEVELSDPVYEVVYGLYSLPDNAFGEIRGFAELNGARICRPDGWATADLEVEGLSPPVVTYVQPRNADGCVEALLNGEADVMSIEIESAVDSMERAGATEKIQQNPYLIKIASLHFATHVTNERGKEYIQMLNRGLAEMRETGEWYDIVASTLVEANAVSN
ncbi:LysM peptidoglycan-binding domain-containing protein [Tabrizicola sp.]|uniref:LysM peptidoglycan-binding domain-containing protein n=1 Tax=Tabrizicola sp. TaxID=2005166 RepID=UPI003F3E791A